MSEKKMRWHNLTRQVFEEECQEEILVYVPCHLDAQLRLRAPNCSMDFYITREEIVGLAKLVGLKIKEDC